MYKKHVLENGLTIIGEEIPYVKSISLGVWINAGSRIEDEEISGVSHFIEHMLFKGTRNRTSKQIASEIDNLGGQINAFTSKECTCYYVKLLDSHIDIGIDVLSDMILNSKFNEDDLDKERSVIIEELKMYEDSPEDLAYDLLTENIYKNDPLGMNIIGTEESLNRLNREKLLDYFNKYYVPNNSVIAISVSYTHLLGRNYKLSGEVIHSKKLGRTIGFPTANISINKNMIIPKVGIYATKVYVNGKIYYGATNIGYNPTVNGDNLSIETNILNFDEDIYGKVITIEFLERIRDEKKFNGIEELKSQLQKDTNYVCKKYICKREKVMIQ